MMAERERFVDTPMGAARRAFTEAKQRQAKEGDGDSAAPAPLEAAVAAALAHPAASTQPPVPVPSKNLQPLLQAAQRVCDVKGTSIPIEEVEALGAALARFAPTQPEEEQR